MLSYKGLQHVPQFGWSRMEASYYWLNYATLNGSIGIGASSFMDLSDADLQKLLLCSYTRFWDYLMGWQLFNPLCMAVSSWWLDIVGNVFSNLLYYKVKMFLPQQWFRKSISTWFTDRLWALTLQIVWILEMDAGNCGRTKSNQMRSELSFLEWLVYRRSAPLWMGLLSKEPMK